MNNLINALFVETNGVYFNLDNVEAFDMNKNAFSCKNGAPAICHPPCKRWGRYWSGGPSVKIKKILGDDGNCFAHSLWYVRTFGGVIEHPEGSHAYSYYGINKPSWHKGWIKADEYGGFVCSVAQGNYGHKSRKMTWIYANGVDLFDFDWSIPKGMMRMDEGRIKIERNNDLFKPTKRITPQDRVVTPLEFRDILIKMAKSKYDN